MESYADAIVGRVGEGLNVEQRKVCVIERSKDRLLTLSQRLTIGVELAGKVGAFHSFHMYRSLTLYGLVKSPNFSSFWMNLRQDFPLRVHGPSSTFFATSPVMVRQFFARSISLLPNCSKLSTGYFCCVKEDRPATLETLVTMPRN
jgi:hypothetical protein